MAQRSHNQRRRRRRGRGSGGRIFLTLLALVLIVGAVAAALTVFFKIRTVAVSGESRYPADQLVAASGIETGRNMFLFNKFAAQSRMFAEYPYLDEISIRRRLPDTVEIQITECRPAAVLHSFSRYEAPGDKPSDPTVTTEREEYFLIDLKGKLLEAVSAGDAGNWCVVEGVSLKNPRVGKYAEPLEEQKKKPLFLVLNSVNDHDILLNIDFLDLTETYGISFQYQTRFTVRLGTSEDVDKKLRYMDLIIEEYLSETDRGTIDVSNPGAAARFIRG